MPTGPSSSQFEIRSTKYGGRGAFASQHIPKDTLVLSCQAPYASVISRKFRKEVCGWCFAWSWDVKRGGSWNISVQLSQVGKRIILGKGNSNVANGGVWFCDEMCKLAWIRDGEGRSDGEEVFAGVRGLVNSALEKCLTSLEKAKSKTTETLTDANRDLGWATLFETLEKKDPGSLSLEYLEDAWIQAERLYQNSGSMTPLCAKEKTKASSLSLDLSLSELELDTARFVLSGLLKKAIDENCTEVMRAEQDDLGEVQSQARLFSIARVGSWTDLIDLQDNAYAHANLKPYILASSIRIWAFLRFVVSSVLRDNKSLSVNESMKPILLSLQRSINTPDDTRAILGREYGNVFGIWDMAPKGEESEMLGWGLYSFASYFNHDCSPTLYKKWKGRTMEFYTLRDIDPSEELCISYVDGEDPFSQRKESLMRGWFFNCGCLKCERELELIPF